MNTYFEIAYAAASHRLCLFTGTGFSKAVSADAAPSWQSLLESICATLPDSARVKSALFPIESPNPLPLEEAAQIIEIELQRQGRSIHEEIAKHISQITLAGDNEAITDFINDNSFEVLTTNYDKLFQSLAGVQSHQTITPGLPIPRSPAQIQIYHVHGSIDSPTNMIVTSDDYFHFLNVDSYFSRKLSTILHENTVVILGYSLGDTNLKSILSDYKGFSRTNVIGGSIFLVSRNEIDQHIKDYYSHSFGIRVIDKIEIHAFFDRINRALPDARRCAEYSRSNIRKVLYEHHNYKDEYLLVESSFFEIIASISAIGTSINAPDVVKLFGRIIEKKIGFTRINGAWEQYAHLASWLLYLGTILEFRNLSIRDVYLSATLQSMNAMSKEKRLGYSWLAYRTWSNGWSNIIPSNRALIKEYIEAKSVWADAIKVVERG